MEESGSDEERTTNKYDKLSDLSLEEVQKLRNKLGIKQFNKKFGSKRLSTTQSGMAKRKVKNSAPIEVSSKRPPNLSKISSMTQKTVTRDPRFDDLSGTFDDQLFKRSYKFIDKLKAKEAKAVRKIAQDEELDDVTRKRAKDMLTRLLMVRMCRTLVCNDKCRNGDYNKEQRKSAKKTTLVEDKVEERLKEERKQAIKEGRKPFFLKASEKNKLVLAEKYKELKDKGQLDSYLKKKRKQNAKKGSSIPERSLR